MTKSKLKAERNFKFIKTNSNFYGVKTKKSPRRSKGLNKGAELRRKLKERESKPRNLFTQIKIWKWKVHDCGNTKNLVYLVSCHINLLCSK